MHQIAGGKTIVEVRRVVEGIVTADRSSEFVLATVRGRFRVELDSAKNARLVHAILMGIDSQYDFGTNTDKLHPALTHRLHAEANMTLVLKSTAFKNGEPIPAKYTAEGEDISPPLSWGGVPDSTQSLVLIVSDPDAPDPAAPKRVYVHWVVYNIPPAVTSLAEGAKGLPKGAVQGLNDWQRSDYGGPAPPIGRHRYFFKLYALDVLLKDVTDPTRKGVEAAMQGHVLAQAELMGTYKMGK